MLGIRLPRDRKFFKTFFRVFFGFLLSFSISRLINQTDLIMISAFGKNAIAAYVIPLDLMFIDTLFSLSITPIITLRMSEATKGGIVEDTKIQMLGVGIITGLGLMIVCLIIYPLIFNFYRLSPEVRRLGFTFLFLMTISIPVRFTMFVESLILHSLNLGKKVVLNNLILFILNIIFNWIFMYSLKFGAIGNYISTVFVSTVGMINLYFRLNVPFERLMNVLTRNWRGVVGLIFNNASYLGWETIRSTSEKILPTVLLYIVSKNWGEFLPLYSITSQWRVLFSMIPVAVLRGLPVAMNLTEMEKVHLSKYENKRFLIQFSLSIFSIFSIIAFVPILFSGKILYAFYNLSGKPYLEIWNTFLIWWLFIFVMMINSAVWIGYAYWKKEFKRFAIIDIIADWVIFLPLFFFSTKSQIPSLFFSIYLMREITVFLGLSALPQLGLNNLSKKLRSIWRF